VRVTVIIKTNPVRVLGGLLNSALMMGPS